MDFLTRKPKSFWLSFAIGWISVAVGGIGVYVVNATGSRSLHLVFFFAVIFLWAALALSAAYYFGAQADGKYINIQKVRLSKQVW